MSPPRRKVVVVSVAVAIANFPWPVRGETGRGGRRGFLSRLHLREPPIRSAFAAAPPPDNTNLLTPALVEREEIPLNRGRKITQHYLCRRMNVKRGRDKIKTRRKWRKFYAAEVAVSLELAKPRVRVCSLAMMMPNANPVIESLQREV